MPKRYENDVEALRVINERITITERFWAPLREDFEEIYAAYRFYTNVTPEVARGEKSNIFVPYAFAQIETKVPRIIQAILGYNPFFQVIGVGQEDHRNAEAVQNLLQHQLENEIDTFFALLTWIKETCIYGNSFMFVPWEKIEKNLARNIPQYMGQDIIGYENKRQKVVKYDGPDLQPLDIFDCFPAPYGTKIQTMPYFIVRSEPTSEYIKKMGEKGIFEKDAVKNILDKAQGSGELDKFRRNRMFYAGMSAQYGEDPKSPRHEMYTMWEDDWVVTKIDNEIMRNRPTPFSEEEKPILMCGDTMIPHELFFLGQVKPILKANYYANDIWNLNADNFYSLVNPGLLISKESGLDEAQFKANPSGIHTVDNPQSAMATVPRGSAQIDTMNQLGLLERIMNITSGSGDVQRGLQAQKGDQTLGEIQTLVEQANYRFDLSIRFIKAFSMKRMLSMLLWRNQDFMPWEKTVRILGKEGAPQFPLITHDQVLGDYDFIMKISSVQGNKLAWGQNLIMFLDVITKDQGQHPELVSMIGQALGIEGSQEYVKNPALKAVAIISQAMRQGLLKNPKQAYLILAAVLNELAPPGSPNAQAVASMLPAAKDAKGIARQTGQSLATPKENEVAV